MPSQNRDELDVFEMFYASVGPSLWDHLRQPEEEDAPVDAVEDVFEVDCVQKASFAQSNRSMLREQL
tara:strand:+ start:379 stop:579 length:201 start_codon:yes stop_codon:yes gene_type:complete